MRPQTTRKLYRSREHRMFLGVAGGIADYFGIDPTLVRVVWVIVALAHPLAPLTAPAVLLIYLALGIVIPNAPREG